MNPVLALARSVGKGGVRALAFAMLLFGALVAPTALAQDPPVPDFFWPFGRALSAGANLSPTEQPLVAFVRGTACGETTTKLAVAGPDTPPGDAGKTVFVVDVLADGAGPTQRPGCGRTGDPVTFYLPLLGQVASQQPQFTQGQARVDLDFSLVLPFRHPLPIVASDGPLQ